MNKNIKVVEVTERPLEGVVERAEFVESLLRDIASEAWVNDKIVIAELARSNDFHMPISQLVSIHFEVVMQLVCYVSE